MARDNGSASAAATPNRSKHPVAVWQGAIALGLIAAAGVFAQPALKGITLPCVSAAVTHGLAGALVGGMATVLSRLLWSGLASALGCAMGWVAVWTLASVGLALSLHGTVSG